MLYLANGASSQAELSDRIVNGTIFINLNTAPLYDDIEYGHGKS